MPPLDEQGIPFVRVLYDNGTYDSNVDGDLKPPIKVSMASQSEAGGFNFSIDNSDFQYNDTFNIFKEVQIWMGDGASPSKKLITGIMTRRGRNKKHPKLGSLKIQGLDFRYPLMRIYVEAAYENNISPCTASGCQTSDLVTDIMTTYGQGLFGFSTYVEASSKYFAAGANETYPIVDRPAWDVIVRFARESGMIAWVDADKELHFEAVGITSSGIILSDEPATGELTIKDIDPVEQDAMLLSNRTKGKGEAGTPIIRQSDNFTKQEEWGFIVEERYQDRNITDSNVMKEIVAARNALNSNDTRESYIVKTENFAYALPGLTVKVTDASLGLSEVELAVQKVTWEYTDGLKIITTFTLAEYPHEYAEFFQRIVEEITILKGQDAGTGDAVKGLLFADNFAVRDGVKIIINTIEKGFIAGNPTFGKAGTARAGISNLSSTTQVNTT